MYRLSHTVAEIKTEDYIRDYRDVAKFIAYCKQCNRYNACWACPPFDFDIDEYISAYDTAYIIGTKIILDAAVMKENESPAWCKDISRRVIEEVRRMADNRLLEMEREYPGSKAFFAGTCVGCSLDQCTRISGEPCVCPDKIRPSLESVGFDIGKTSSDLLHIELKWSADGLLSEYFTLVSGFLTNRQLPESIVFSETANDQVKESLKY